MHIVLISTFLLTYIQLFIHYDIISANPNLKEWDRQHPTILIVILARNKAHTLPYFLGHLEDLDYPKNRIVLFLRTDHNQDETDRILDRWVTYAGDLYHKINFEYDDSKKAYQNEMGPFDWTLERMRNLNRMKQTALDYARNIWADYIFFVDCDVFLTNRRVLQSLISAGHTVVAPFLRGPTNDEHSYTNFVVEDPDDNSTKFDFLFDRQQPGVYAVQQADLALLIDLNDIKSTLINFIDPLAPLGDNDDVTTFSESFQKVGVSYFLDNWLLHGWFTPKMNKNLATLQYDEENLHFLLTEALTNGPPGLLYSPIVPPKSISKRTKFGLDEIFLINLERRPDRFDRMEACFRILGVNYTHLPAIDGKQLTDEKLSELGVRTLVGFRDPYHKRPITTGEIGCFLSHYNIWNYIVEHKLDRVAVFEDDLRFARYFSSMMETLVDDLSRKADFDWDLVYLGRKRLANEPVDPDLSIDGVRYIRKVGYSYWTLGYLLSLNGAKKLLAPDPLKKLVPVDEYLPILFDKHPDLELSQNFAPRNLNAFTVDPLFVHPVRYTGEEGYVSDTENSEVIRDADSMSDSIKMSTSLLSDEL